MKKKIWYLKCGYSQIEFKDILKRTKEVLFSIRMSNDISIKSAKRLNNIEMMLIELQIVDIEESEE